MSLHKDGDGISDELEEDLQTLPTEDNIRHGIGNGIEEDLNEHTMQLLSQAVHIFSQMEHWIELLPRKVTI